MQFKGLEKEMQSAKHRIKTMESNFERCTDHVALHDVLIADHK